MTTMFRRKQRHNPSSWLKQFFRRIGICRFYHASGKGWLESWELAGRTI